MTLFIGEAKNIFIPSSPELIRIEAALDSIEIVRMKAAPCYGSLNGIEPNRTTQRVHPASHFCAYCARIESTGHGAVCTIL
jgi:hypothetical protein